MSKVFTYSEGGLSYTVTVSEDENGNFSAEITVLEGSMDVNAVYWGDDDFSGRSANLGGPLNMNGGGSLFEGERIQWDDAVEVSRPGLGREGEDKESFLQEGESLTVDLDGLESLDDIDFFGIRATSVNGGGSIKGVSGNPEEPEDPMDPEEPEDPEDPEDPDSEVFGKAVFRDDDMVHQQVFLEALGDNAIGTLEEYIAYYEDLTGTTLGSANDPVTRIGLHQFDEEGNLQFVRNEFVDDDFEMPLPCVAVEEEAEGDEEDDNGDYDG